MLAQLILVEIENDKNRGSINDLVSIKHNIFNGKNRLNMPKYRQKTIDTDKNSNPTDGYLGIKSLY